MEAALAHANVAALNCWADDICRRIANSLRREGKTLDVLFNSLAKGGQMIHWPAFDALFTQMEPSLTTRQLQQLWQAFDKNNDGGVSRDEFVRAFTVVEEGAAPESADVAPSMTDLLLSRIHRSIGVGPLSVKTALTVYDTEAEGSLDWQQWRHACRTLRLPLSEPEAAALHNALARGPGGRLVLAVLEAEVARVAMQVLPEERWARTFVSGCAARSLEAGAPGLDQVLGAGGEQAVEEAVLLAALSRHHPVAEAQWLRLRPLLDRRPEDGRVLWQSFLRWASVPVAEVATPRLSGAEVDVCKRVSQALRAQGKSPDELFTALAKGGVMFWPDFVTLFASLEPTITVQQLQSVWRSFDKNGDGGVSREEFRRGLVSQVEPPPPALAIPPTPSHGNVCSRIKTALRREGKTVGDLFESLSKGTSRMQWSEFTSLFIQLEPSLSVVQLERLWKSFDKDGDGSVSREEFERGLAMDVVEQPGATAHMSQA
jgi:Ca2+-binding EF-hand superfamily protein